MFRLMSLIAVCALLAAPAHAFLHQPVSEWIDGRHETGVEVYNNNNRAIRCRIVSFVSRSESQESSTRTENATLTIQPGETRQTRRYRGFLVNYRIDCSWS